MTVDPATPEGRRRTRRGLLLLGFTLVFPAVQGLLLRWAVVSGSTAVWALWASFVAGAVFGFVAEWLAERRRRGPG